MFKLVINNKERAYSKELNEQESSDFLGKKIKEKVSGNSFGFKGYEFEIMGGSDRQGFPMRFDLPGSARKRILLAKGPCVKIKRKGMRKRKTVRGRIISEEIKQINIKVLKEGEKKLVDMFPKKEEVELLKKAPAKDEKPKEAPKEEKKVEDKKVEEKKEVKEEPKKEAEVKKEETLKEEEKK